MSQSIKINIAANEVFPCDVPGCTSKRHRVAKYCYKHWLAYRRWGDPEAKAIHHREYKTQIDEVARLLDANPEHKGVQLGITFIERWIDSAVTMGAGPCPERVAKFQGVISPRTLLVELAAVWVYTKDHPEKVKHDTHLRHILGNRILTYGSRVRELWEPHGSSVARVKGKEAREAGRVILVHIGELLKTIHSAVLEKRRVMVEKAEAQKEKFTL